LASRSNVPTRVSVDTAHAVDRYLLDEEILDDWLGLWLIL
jgi:hypothetical protein